MFPDTLQAWRHGEELKCEDEARDRLLACSRSFGFRRAIILSYQSVVTQDELSTRVHLPALDTKKPTETFAAATHWRV